jgi:hypothetical protein
VTLYLPSDVTINSYYKYGPTPGNSTDHWYSFAYDGTTGATLSAGKVVLHFVDGLRGDADLTANGKVVDPGAPGRGPRAYRWLGFLPPLAPENKRVFKQGSTIPVKFRIADPEGGPVPDAGATLAVYRAGAGEAEVISTAAGDWGNRFRYDPAGDQYIFNLSTKATSYVGGYTYTYSMVVTLDDGQTHRLDFSLR